MTRSSYGESLDAVIFDFYNTLAHAPGFTAEVAMAELCASLGSQIDPAQLRAAYGRQIQAYWSGPAARGEEQHNTVWVAAALSELGWSSLPQDAHVAAAVDAYFNRYARELVLFPGVAQALTQLGGCYRLGLLSNFTDPRPVRTLLEREGLTGHFGSIVISAEVGCRKPQSAIFERTLGDLDVRPARALYVGDDPVDDVVGARGAGMSTAWIQRAERPLLARDFSLGEHPGGADATPDFTLAGVDELGALLLIAS